MSDTGRIVLLAIAALIAGFLISKLVRRVRVGKALDSITDTNSSTETSTSTNTSTGTPNNETQRNSNYGCTPALVNKGIPYCVGGKALRKKVVGEEYRFVCC